MEVVVAVPPPPPSSSSSMEFNFHSNCSSPYITAPSSPQRFANFFFSAPTSPTPTLSSASASNTTQVDVKFNFHDPSLSAQQLFPSGKITPLESPSQTTNKNQNSTSGRENKTRKQSLLSSQQYKGDHERASSFSISDVSFCDQQKDKNNCEKYKTSESVPDSSSMWSIAFWKGRRKWRLKDFLLFRSASEGRASNKDPFRKYEDVRNMSVRSADSAGSVSRRRGPVSAHELHYTVNRAASVELKKKTLLPYKQGLLGCLGFNPHMHHFNARIGSSER